ALRFGDRAPEILTGGCLQQSLLDRIFVEREGGGEPRWRRRLALPLVGLAVHGKEGVHRPFEVRLMRRKQTNQSSAPLEDGVVFAAPNREVAVGLLQNFDRVVADVEKLCDQIVLLPDVGVMGGGTTLFQRGIAGIGVEDEKRVGKCDQRAQYSQ